MKNEIQSNPTSKLKSIVQGERFREQLQLCLPKDLPAETLQRIAVTTITKTPAIAQCSPESICSCLLDLAAAGLVPDGRRAHLIPRGNQCTLLIDYKGFVEMAYRNEKIVKVFAETICEHDFFSHGKGSILGHTWDVMEDRGEIKGAYAEVTFSSGESVATILSRAEIEDIRDKASQSAKGSSSPWVQWFGEMSKKSAIRRLMKMIPLPAESSGALAADGEAIEIEAKASKPAQRATPAERPAEKLETKLDLEAEKDREAKPEPEPEPDDAEESLI